MTEKQMDKLADIIVTKLISRQAEYDAEFTKNLAESVGSDYDVNVEYYTAYQKSIDEQIQELEDQIDSCIKTDNFEQIKPLQDKINILLNGKN
jgi:transcription termination factor NusB